MNTWSPRYEDRYAAKTRRNNLIAEIMKADQAGDIARAAKLREEAGSIERGIRTDAIPGR